MKSLADDREEVAAVRCPIRPPEIVGIDAVIGRPALTFDGESCIYEGPTELTPGPGELTFMSEDPEYPASVSFEKLDDDKTFQDMIDYISPEPSTAVTIPLTGKFSRHRLQNPVFASPVVRTWNAIA